MGDEQGDRSTPLQVYRIIYQSDQKKWVCTGKGTLKTLALEEKEGWHLIDLLRLKDIGFLIEQGAKHFGIALAIDLRILEKQPLSGSDAGLISIHFNKDCSIIPPSLASTEFFYHQTTCRHLLMKRAQKLQYCMNLLLIPNLNKIMYAILTHNELSVHLCV